MKWRDSDNDPGGSAGTLTTTDVLSTGVWIYIVGVWDSNNNEQKTYHEDNQKTNCRLGNEKY